MTLRSKLLAWWLGLMLVLVPALASAELVREGDWSGEDPKISLSVQGMPRGEAVRRIAEAAGWSVVMEAGPTDPVDVHVKDQPAGKVLELVLSDRRYVAHRDGTLIAIRAQADAPIEPAEPAAAPAAPAPPSAPPAGATAAPKDPQRTAEDRVVTGGSTRVEAGETVHDLVVMGGSAEVLGIVNGDVSVMGGKAVIRKGAHVKGDVVVLGGAVDIEDGGQVDGDVGALGGKVSRGDNTKVNFSIAATPSEKKARPVLSALRDVGSALTRTALLFVFGAVLMALATRRMEQLETEIAARPMRTFALGVVGLIATAILMVVLCVTIVGIPLAVIGALLLAFSTYVGIAAALGTVGGALVQHRSKNPYVHLAVGCVLYLILSSLPFVGGFVTAVVVLIGFGALVATRAAGLMRPKSRGVGDPYRSPA